MGSMPIAHSHARKWWKEAVVYQIYPSSFYDSNGDGVGDIPGIIEKLPYIASLGVDCIWVSPHYASPQIDMGYDISDYEDIYPKYGTLEQTQHLIDRCHELDMKIIFDLVINHTSDQHKWFQESRSSKYNPKRDWYFWKPPRGWEDGKPLAPNNWRSGFGGPAWEFDEVTQEFYLHLFAVEMPDLNWENEEARKAIYETSMHYWLRRGIDGFRIDVVNKYSKDLNFPDVEVVDPAVYDQPCAAQTCNGPRMHEFLSEMHDVLSQYKTFDGMEIMTVGELPCLSEEDEIREYVSAAEKRLDMVFHFETMRLGSAHSDRSTLTPFTVADFKDSLAIWQNFVNGTDAWTTLYLENHDQGRSISRFGDQSSETLRIRSGKLLAVILATLTGTLFIYQGQEIGMINMPRDHDVEDYKDIWTVNLINLHKARGLDNEQLEDMLTCLGTLARDHARTPMQWDDSRNAGFQGTITDSEPWMKVNNTYKRINVQKQQDDPDSLLSFWRNLLKLRKQYKSCTVYGRFTMLFSHKDVFAFMKEGSNGQIVVVAANMSSDPKPWHMPRGLGVTERLNSVHNIYGKQQGILQPWEARVYTSK